MKNLMMLCLVFLSVACGKKKEIQLVETPVAATVLRSWVCHFESMGNDFELIIPLQDMVFGVQNVFTELICDKTVSPIQCQAIDVKATINPNVIHQVDFSDPNVTRDINYVLTNTTLRVIEPATPDIPGDLVCH